MKHKLVSSIIVVTGMVALFLAACTTQKTAATAVLPQVDSKTPDISLTPAATGTNAMLMGKDGALGKGRMPQIMYSIDREKVYLNDGSTLRVLNTKDMSEISLLKNISDNGYGYLKAVSPDGSLVIIESWYKFQVMDIRTQQTLTFSNGYQGSERDAPIFRSDGRYIIYRAT